LDLRGEVTGGWRKLHNEELHTLHPSPNIIRIINSWAMRCAGYITCMGESKNAYKILVRMPERDLGLDW
jgi:hypothetical protein